jgi:arylsulfatase A-like enzyme
LETLKSVNQHVKELVHTLNRQGQLDDTFILYTSDNGFRFGQHRLAIDKRHLYEHDIYVPFVVWGPNIAPNSISSQIVASVDIAPTILNIAKAKQSTGRFAKKTKEDIPHYKTRSQKIKRSISDFLK